MPSASSRARGHAHKGAVALTDAAIGRFGRKAKAARIAATPDRLTRLEHLSYG